MPHRTSEEEQPTAPASGSAPPPGAMVPPPLPSQDNIVTPEPTPAEPAVDPPAEPVVSPASEEAEPLQEQNQEDVSVVLDEERSEMASIMGASLELPPLEKDTEGKVSIDDLLRYVVDARSSDLHVKTGSPPTIRVSGHLQPLDYPVLGAPEAHEMAYALMPEKEQGVLEDSGEVDFAYSLPGVSRFRVNVHKQRGSLGIAARRILPGAPDFKDLGLPAVVETLANEHRGLFLVTGPTSSGKTTTCGAIIKHINRSRRCHIVTIEDPIEILHKDEMSVVTQREVGQDTNDFHAALRAAMRQDPDVIFVGEIRDLETVQAALQAAETGHFVLATLHTTDVAETISRIIDFYPSHQQKQVRVALGGSLVGVVTQRLLPKIDGGRAPAIEVMVMNGRIRDCILDPEKTHAIHDIVEESGFYGMQTFDQALIQLYREGVVTLEDAKSAANTPHDFQLALQKAGLLKV